jgi:hypothetical protein
LTYLRISVPSEVTVRTTGRVRKNGCASSSETGTPLQASCAACQTDHAHNECNKSNSHLPAPFQSIAFYS